MRAKMSWIVGIVSVVVLVLMTQSRVIAQQTSAQPRAAATLPAAVPAQPVVVTNGPEQSVPVTIQGAPTVTLSGTSTVNAVVSGAVSIDGTPTVNIGNTPVVTFSNTDATPIFVRDVDRPVEGPSMPITITGLCNGNATSETLLFTIPAIWNSFTLTDFVLGGIGVVSSTFNLRQPPNGTALTLVVPLNQSVAHTFGTPIVFHGFNGSEIKMSCGGASAVTVTLTGKLQ